jgi:hypothetical protein
VDVRPRDVAELASLPDGNDFAFKDALGFADMRFLVLLLRMTLDEGCGDGFNKIASGRFSSPPSWLPRDLRPSRRRRAVLARSRAGLSPMTG